MIAIGGGGINNLYLGETKILKAYLGSTLVYQKKATVTVNVVINGEIIKDETITVMLGNKYGQTVTVTSSSFNVIFENVEPGQYLVNANASAYTILGSRTITVEYEDLSTSIVVQPTQYNMYYVTVISNAETTPGGGYYPTTVKVSGSVNDNFTINSSSYSKQYQVKRKNYISVIVSNYYGTRSYSITAIGTNQFINAYCYPAQN